MRRAAFLVILTLLSACKSEQGMPSAIPKIRAGDPASNATAVAKLVEQLCIRNGDDSARFGEAIRATGWGFEQVQNLDPKNPYSVDVWRASDAQVIHGKLAGDEILVCNVAVEDGVVADEPFLRAISKLSREPQKDGEWRWRLGAKEFVMDFATGPDKAFGTQVNVEIWHLRWWQRLLG